ncbi:hypothetical protein UZ36_02975 [Candidatus Nitromaritima sp. SCGC AAA799-C22]|nr:hypothetical protein UZ36_02975 [Candidatus Nitromaritima sp. SCGC AAA799-C22]
MYRKFRPILDYLEQETLAQRSPVKIKLRIFPSYEKAVDEIVEGTLDIARFGPASYIGAKARNSNIRLLVVEHKNGLKRFKGFLFSTQDTPIRSIQDLKGKSIAFGNRNSTFTYLFMAELVKANIKAGDLERYSFLGRHDKVALAVANHNYDVGVVKENTFYKFSKSKKLKIISEISNITKPWLVREGFPEKYYALLQSALIKLQDKTVLKNLGQDGFLLVSDEDYDYVRDGIALSQKFGGKMSTD